MSARVLVVDDSGFFRRRVTEIIDADPLLEVVGAAEDGQQAVEMAAKLKPDVITMDIEMPVMDGITATRKIMASHPTPIIMFSSLTTDGAQATFDALDAGAVDFLPKRFEDISQDRNEAKQILCQRVRALVRKGRTPLSVPVTHKPEAKLSLKPPATPVSVLAPKLAPVSKNSIKLLAIGSSTGGPVALQKVLTALPANFPVPILLVQHMPGTFTPAFAQRLDKLCAINIKEAVDGDTLTPGTALLAPGGKQMQIEVKAGSTVVRVTESDPGQTYKPSVDLTFRSIDKVYPDNTLAVVLTGMGADGREGAKELHGHGSVIWAQDEQSCVVYGMPAAIVDAGVAEKILSIEEIGAKIVQRV